MNRNLSVIVGLSIAIGALSACSAPYKDFERINVEGHNLIESIELPADFHSVPSNQEVWPGSVAFGREKSEDKVTFLKGYVYEEPINKGQDVEIDGRSVRVNKWFGDKLTGHEARPTFEGSTEFSLRVCSPDKTNYLIDLSFAGCEKLDCDKVVRSIKWKRTPRS